jgi:hypothetical protein
MMRNVFGGAMVLSIVGAVVLGGILAFQSQQTTNEFSAKVGDATWALAYESEPNTIVPGYGLEVVGEGYIANDPTSSFSLVNTGGSVTISEVTSGCPSQLFGSLVKVVQTAPVAPGDGFNTTWTGTGTAVQNIPASLISTSDEVGGPPPPSEVSDATWGTYPGAFQAMLSLPGSVPASCFGATVAYHVTINVTPQPVDLSNPGPSAPGAG